MRFGLTENRLARWGIWPFLATVTVIVQGCSPSDQRATPRGAASGTPARSDAVRASALTGEIAFGGTDGHLWLINAKTGGRQQVTHGQGGVDFDPRWSPDGRQIVFRSTRFPVPDPQGTGLDGILIVNRDGSEENLISGTRGGLAAAWSPDGRTIVYSTSFDEVNEHLAAYDVASRQTRDLGVYGEGVNWSPDGNLVLVGRLQGIVDALAGRRSGPQNWEIWRFRGDFSNPVRLTDSPGDDSSGGWSPDGSKILFTTKRRDAGDVWVMQADGTGPHALVAWDGNQSAEGYLRDGRMLFTDNVGPPTWYLLTAAGALQRVDSLSGIESPVAWRAVGP
jgi:Tol biopolymer transport system component